MIPPLLQDVSRLGLRKVVCVLEDLHLDVDRPISQTHLARLVRLAVQMNQTGIAAVQVIGTYWSGETHRVRRTYRTLCAGVGLEERNIDALPYEFAVQLVEQACKAFNVTLETSTEQMASIFAKHAATPYAITLYLRDQAGKSISGINQDHPAFGAGWQYWRDQYIELIERGRRDEQRVLLLIRVLRDLRFDPLTSHLLESIFCRWTDQAPSAYLLAMQDLTSRYWLRERNGILYFDNQQVARSVFKLSTAEYALLLDELAPHVLGVTTGDAVHRQVELRRTFGRLYRGCERLTESKHYLAAALAQIEGAPGNGELIATLHYDLSITSNFQGDLPGALNHCERAIAVARMRGGISSSRMGVFECQLGHLLQIGLRSEMAVEHYRRALELMRPVDFMYGNCAGNLAAMLVRLDRHEEAREVLRSLDGIDIPQRDEELIQELRAKLGV